LSRGKQVYSCIRLRVRDICTAAVARQQEDRQIVSRRVNSGRDFRMRRLLPVAAVAILSAQVAHAATPPTPLLRIPTAAQVRIRSIQEIEPRSRIKAVEIYDRVRAELLAGGYDPRVVAGALSAMTADGLASFVRPNKMVRVDLHLPRPSIAEELCDAERIRSVVSDVERQLPPRRQDVFIPEPANIYTVAGGVGGHMTQIYRAFDGIEGNCSPSPPRRASKPKWRTALRLSWTGDPAVDGAVRRSLARLRRQVPGLTIDDRSFSTSPGSVNFWLGERQRFHGIVATGLRDCVRHGLCALSQIAGAQAGSARSSSVGLRELYLSRPYARIDSPFAVIAVNGRDEIVGAGCGAMDLGSDAAIGANPDDYALLCLAQGLGAAPGALADTGMQEISMKEVLHQALVQLREIYMK
jgi:hypothetical protein